MRPIILWRGNEFEREELSAAQQFFTCTNRRPEIRQDDLIIGRYSLYPFYFEQWQDFEYVGAKLINSYNQHRYVADLGNYVIDLEGLTPRTWSDIRYIPDNTEFVLKGETNSRKSNWLNDMYAKNKQQAIDIYNRLGNDGLLSQQKIYIREYIPLTKYLDGINGMPVSKEFRFFVAYGKVISGGFYWGNYIEDIGFEPSIQEVPSEFLDKIISKIDHQCNFYTIDVAQTLSGDWIVIELNDGCQSGLSCNYPITLYDNLNQAISNQFT